MNEIYLVKVNPDGTKTIGDRLNLGGGGVNEEELKNWISENYLKLTGGTVKGNLVLEKEPDGFDNWELNIRNSEVERNTVVEEASSRGLMFTDKKNDVLSFISSGVDTDQNVILKLNCRDFLNRKYWPSISLVAPRVGQAYATAPTHSTYEYGQIIVTEQAMQDYAPQKLTTRTIFHVNANTGSDTADLFNGRGLSEDKSFKTLESCFNFISHNYFGNVLCTIQLHSDVTFGSQEYYLNDFCSGITLGSDSTKRTVTLSDNLTLMSGRWVFSNIKLNLVNYQISLSSTSKSVLLYVYNNTEMTGSALKLSCSGCNSTISTDGLSLSGTASSDGLMYASYNGTIKISNISGTVTGKRYSCTYGGSILVGGKGANAIPGTIAGTCDSSSTYA